MRELANTPGAAPAPLAARGGAAMSQPRKNARELGGTAGIGTTPDHITFTLQIVALPGCPDPVTRLRRALKALRRVYGFRCAVATQSPVEPACGLGGGEADHGTPVRSNGPAGALDGGAR